MVMKANTIFSVGFFCLTLQTELLYVAQQETGCFDFRMIKKE